MQGRFYEDICPLCNRKTVFMSLEPRCPLCEIGNNKVVHISLPFKEEKEAS